MTETEQPAVRILVLNRGYVLAGWCLNPTNYALWIPVTNSRIIRRWGTSTGLSQLCDGPIEGSTVLDALAPLRTIPVGAVIDVLEVESAEGKKAWAKVLTRKGVE